MYSALGGVISTCALQVFHIISLVLRRSLYIRQNLYNLIMAPQKDNEMNSLSGNPDMDKLARLGHKQQLEVGSLPHPFEKSGEVIADHAQRNFSLVSMLALSVSLMATWEAFSR